MDRRISIHGSVFVLAAVMLLVLPVQWVMAAAAAAAVHEVCHYLAVCAVHGTVYSVAIGCRGAVMETSFLTDAQTILCALAGPAGSFLLVCLYPVFPRMALCAFVQGLYNLLPVYPLDGGRVLRATVRLLLPADTAERIFRTAEILLGIAVCMLGLLGTFRYRLGICPMIPGWIALGRIFCGKIPCIGDKLAVQ